MLRGGQRAFSLATARHRAASAALVLLALLLPQAPLLQCDAARPPPAVLRRPPPLVSVPGIANAPVEMIPAADNAATPDGALTSEAIAAQVTQVPPSPPPSPPAAYSPPPASNGRTSGTATAAPAPGTEALGLTTSVANAAALSAALYNSSVSDILLLSNITVDSGWANAGLFTVTLNRSVSIAPAPSLLQDAAEEPPTLDFGLQAFCILVEDSGSIAFSNMSLRGVAPASSGLDPGTGSDLAPSETYRVVGLPLWPSLAALPGAKFVLDSATIYFHDNSGYVNCTFFQDKVGPQYSAYYGSAAVSDAADGGLYVNGSHVVALPITQGNEKVGDAELATTDVVSRCELATGTVFAAGPPRPDGPHFPWWAGVLIGVFVALLLVGLLIVALLLRRRRHMRRRDADMQQWAGRSTPGSKNSSDNSKFSNGTFRESGDEKGSGALGALWPAGSHNLSSQASDEVMTLGAYHKQLLAMRAGSGLEGIEVGPILGRGSYGRVYKGRWNGALVAIKVIDATPFANAVTIDAARESLLAASMSHPNVVACYKICSVRMGDSAASGEVEVEPEVAGLVPGRGAGSPEGSGRGGKVPIAEVPTEDIETLGQEVLETWMLLEYADRGSLEQAIKTHRFRRRPGAAVDMVAVYKSLLDIATGMGYLHGLGIVHGDLKPANVLLKSTVTDSRGFICKLADFGLSRILDLNSTHVSTQSFGTVPYMPPELLSSGRMSRGVDAYSFGMLMWEVYTGAQPYQNMQFGQVMFNVVHEGLRPEVPADCPEGYVALMRSCWAPAAGDRPTFEDVVAELAQQTKAASAAAKKAAEGAASTAAATAGAAAVAADGRRLAPIPQSPAQSPAPSPGAKPPLAGGRRALLAAEDSGGGLPLRRTSVDQPERASHSFRDFRKAVAAGRGLSFLRAQRQPPPPTATGQPSPAALAALRAAPAAGDIRGEWVPRAASVTGSQAPYMASLPPVHRKSASATDYAPRGGALSGLGLHTSGAGSDGGGDAGLRPQPPQASLDGGGANGSGGGEVELQSVVPALERVSGPGSPGKGGSRG